MSAESEIGLIGLGVMGASLSLNIASREVSISVFNRTSAKIDSLLVLASKEKLVGYISGFKDILDFVSSLKTPRSIILLLTSGDAVDDMISRLIPLLAPNDLIIDGGNEWYSNTERRGALLTQHKIKYIGMGISGGEEGARFGPSLMPGGDKEGYFRIENILLKIAAKSEMGPCVTYIGSGGSGNYVKMVHNGIEYAEMELIAEAYDILKSIGSFSNEGMSNIFKNWNEMELKSYLIEITSKIMSYKELNSTYLVDLILDKTSSKGTGKWTVQEGAEQGIFLASISSALDMRYISNLKEERIQASEILRLDPLPIDQDPVDHNILVNDLRNALYCSKICSYAQGFSLIKKSSDNHHWNLNLSEIARIWKNGCIIRSDFLNFIIQAYQSDPNLCNLLLYPPISEELFKRQKSWRNICTLCFGKGIACPAFSASLAYFDSYRRARLPANLTQAQRDYFGAHTYQKIDGSGPHHTQWPS